MPSNYKSPFASSFKSAVNRGTSYTAAVENIAKRNNTPTTFVWNSLYKANLVWRQKFNGQWIYFPTSWNKGKAASWKNSQFECWQYFCEWFISNGYCTPENLKKHCGSQAEFMNFCRKYFAKQFNNNTTTRKSTGRKTTSKSKTTRKSYKFPASKSTSKTRRYRRAA